MTARRHKPMAVGRAAGSRAASRQRGVAVLAATTALLVAMTLGLVYVNRSLIFEQRSMSNQFRALRAFEAAQAGLDWAGMMLNYQAGIDEQCVHTGNTSDATFRDRFLRPDMTQQFDPVTDALATCALGDSAGALVCNCSATGSAPGSAGGTGTGTGTASGSGSGTASGSASGKVIPGGAPTDVASMQGEAAVRFDVSFRKAAGEEQAVIVTSRGCTGTADRCDAAPQGATGQATSKVIAEFRLLKPAPSPTPPSASTSSTSTSTPAVPASSPRPMVLVPGTWHDY